MDDQDTVDALLLVDPQNCFMPNGELPVPRGDEIIPVANLLIPEFDIVFASRDWHPESHCSFARCHQGVEPYGMALFPDGVERMVWPDHGVAGTVGAAWHPDLKLPKGAIIIDKGVDAHVDSPGAFWDVTRTHKTNLEAELRAKGVNTLYIMGVATDVCVLFTVLDALVAGFTVYLIADGCRGVDPTGTQEAIDRMMATGAKMLLQSEV